MAQAITNSLSPSVPVVNISNKYIKIPAHFPVAIGTQYQAKAAVPLNLVRQLYEPTEADRQENIRQRLEQIGSIINPEKFNISSETATPAQKKQLRELLTRHATVFNWNRNDFTKIKTFETFLNLVDRTPFQKVHFTLPYRLRETVKNQILSLLNQGVIQPSNSPYRKNLIAVPKPGNTSEIRLVIDLRENNKHCQSVAEPIESIPNVIEKMAKATWYHRIDLKSSFFQLRLNPQDRASTAFSVRDLNLPVTQFQLKTMPMGHKNASIALQRVLRQIVDNIFPLNTALYVDDFFIFGGSLPEINKVLKAVLIQGEKHGVLFNLDKSEFALTELRCLGHILKAGTIKPDPDKVKALASIPRPTTMKQLRSWLAAVNFYRNHFEHISLTLAPLYAAMKGSPKKLLWTPAMEEAYNLMQQAITSPPLLQIFSAENTEHMLMTDSSTIGVGAVLLYRQIGTEKWKPVIYLSSKHPPRVKPEPIYAQELFALYYALSKLQRYLIGSKFKVMTDASALLAVRNTKLTPKLIRWVEFISQFDFEIAHVRSNLNGISDILSRNPLPIDPHAVEITEQERLDATIAFIGCQYRFTQITKGGLHFFQNNFSAGTCSNRPSPLP